MEQEERIQKEIEKTLKAYDDLPRLEGNPFLFTRLQAELASDKHGGARQRGTVSLLKPVALALIIALNILTAVYILESGSTSSHEQLIDSLSMEYNPAQSDF